MLLTQPGSHLSSKPAVYVSELDRPVECADKLTIPLASDDDLVQGLLHKAFPGHAISEVFSTHEGHHF